MKKYHLILICIFFLAILSTSYAEQINGINFNLPQEYTGGYNSNSTIYGESYTKQNKIIINVYTKLETYKLDVGEEIDNAKSIENITIEGHPAVLIKNPKYIRLFFESSNKLVSIQLPNTNQLNDNIIKLVKSTPDSTITQDQLYNILLHSWESYNPKLFIPDKNITVNGITLTIPGPYQNGTFSNVKYGIGAYTLFIKESFFRIFVYSDTENIDTYVGYMLTKASKTEEINIEGHPAILLTYSTKYSTGNVNSTEIMFESDGKIVTIEIPYSYALTDTGRNIVRSTPAPTLDETEFHKLMHDAVKDYEDEEAMEESSYVSYTDGYYSGSRAGYGNGYSSGLRNGVILGSIISRM